MIRYGFFIGAPDRGSEQINFDIFISSFRGAFRDSSGKPIADFPADCFLDRDRHDGQRQPQSSDKFHRSGSWQVLLF